MDKETKDIKLIFSEALEKKTTKEQTAYLDKACGNDINLRKKVEALLKAYDEADDVPEAPIISQSTFDISPLTEGPGTVIGRYKLLQQIGEGGFGVVYMAEQQRPIRRKVALKIIKLGMDTKQVIARFEAERQALAMMDHPNIAHVFDAGATDTGRPYFVMELVKGVPITEYCDSNNLSTDERLTLFIDVCKAVQHAHQKGIIHRDIKPSNVMITLRDGVPVPKVIDFGIAKATQQRLTEKTLFTEFRQLIGTPEYMSPEQAEMSELDVDTRSDIYSLGVLLYELLTGTTPFDAKKLRSAAFDEIVRIIREAEPPKPSTRLSTLGETLTDIARHRHAGPGQLCRLVRGDLDWIVMRTLEKDRTRRYETTNELAMDIERYMNDEPVMAGPPSTAYRLKKFLRRNKTSVILASSIAAALVVGLCLATIGFVQASRQRQRAEANLSFALDALDKIYLGVSEEQLPKEEVIKEADRKLLEKALEFYERFAEENSNNIALRKETARAYCRVGIVEYKLGQYDKAEPALRTAIAMYEELTREFADVPKYRSNLAVSHINLGNVLLEKGELNEVQKVYCTAIAIYEELVSEFPDKPSYRSDLAGCQANLGRVLNDKGKLDEAEKASHAAIAMYEKLVREFPDNSGYRSDLAGCQANLGRVLNDKGKPDEAEKAFRTAVVIHEKLVSDVPDNSRYRSGLAGSHNNLGTVLNDKGQLDEAEKAHRSAVVIYEELLSEFPSMPKYRSDLARSQANLGRVLNDKGKLDEAEKASHAAIAMYEKLVREFPDVPEYRSGLARSQANLGRVLNDKGKLDEAQKAYRNAIVIYEELAREFADNSGYRSSLAASQADLGAVLLDKGELDEAEKAFRTAIVTYEELVREFPDKPVYQSSLAMCYNNLGVVLKDRGELDEAEITYRDAIATYEELVGECPDVPNYRSELALSYNKLGFSVLRVKGELDDAEKACSSALAICEKLTQEFPDVPKYRSELASSHNGLGGVLCDKGELDNGEQALRTAIAIREELVNKFADVRGYRSGLAWSHHNLGIVLEKNGKLDEVEQAHLSALAIREGLVSEFPDVPKYRSDRASSYNSFAWQLVTNPDISPSDAAFAVELAEKAVQAAPEASAYWNTLGVAHYRAGSWEDAITALRKSRDLGTGSHDGIDLFFLAMAQFQLGSKDEARQNYNQAVEWIEQHAANEELRRFSAEAAELLDISEKPAEKEKELEEKENE